jgi:hypothetical protein
MIPDDSPLKSPPPNEEIDFDESSEFNEEIDEIRPPQAQLVHPLTNMTNYLILNLNNQLFNRQMIQ